MNGNDVEGPQPSSSGSAVTTTARPWLMAAIALALGCVVALILGEVVVRIVEPRPDTPGAPLQGSPRLYGYAPSSQGYAGGVAFTTNASGFRGPDFTDLDTAFVILVLGDSYAFGYGVDYADAFPALLEVRLRSEYPGANVRVIDLGIPGYDTSQELAVLTEWAPLLHPQMVLLQYHLNDIQRHPEVRGAGQGVTSPGAEPTLDQVRRHLHLFRFLLPRLAGVARALGLPIRTTATAELGDYVGDSPAWQANQRVLQQLFASAHSTGVPVGVLIVPYVVELDEHHPLVSAYDEVLRFCASQKVPAVNAFEYFKGHNAGTMWINPFDGHPNAAGHALLARAADELVSMMGLKVRVSK